MKKRLIALVCVALMALSLAACSSTKTEIKKDSADKSKDSDGKVYKVGISQLVTHDALDAATEGFKEALTDLLGDQVEFDYQNASNDTALCATIANGFVSDGVDLIMANATPALQTAAAATATIPVLGTSVTEYGVAFGIEGFDGVLGTNVSGTSDLAPLDKQATMIQT